MCSARLAQEACLAGELAEDAHGRPLVCAKGEVAVRALPRREVQRRHILAAVVDVKHAVRRSHDVLRAYQCPCALQAPAFMIDMIRK